MNRKIFNFTVIILALLFILFLITSNKEVLKSVSFSISIWKDNLFPTLFPFFVVSNILIQYNFTNVISKLFSYPIRVIYKLPPEASYILISSLFSGFPSGAKYTTNLVEKGIIDSKTGTQLITFAHYSNPLFILGFIGNILNKELAIIILISHILSGLITGKIFTHQNNKKPYTNSVKKEDNYLNFGKVLSSSINDSLNTMFLLLGIITIFSLITTFITNIFQFNSFIRAIIAGTLEMTQGIKLVSILKISNYLKLILITEFISFGGISVHMQVLSIIADSNIKYKPFLIARIIHSIIAIGLVSIFYFITYQYYQ